MLKKTVAFIAGGTGIVGSALVKDLLKNGAKVYVTSRSEEKINALNNKISNDYKQQLVVIKANVSNEKECIEVRDEIIKRDGKVEHVVSSLGTWWDKGLLSDQSVDEFHNVIDDTLTSHFIVYKTFSKLLLKQKMSTYTFITGNFGERCYIPEASLSSVGIAGVYGLYQAAFAEYKKNENLKINEIRYNVWIRDQPDKEFDSEKHSFEVGNDWAAKFITKAIIKHKGGQYMISSRKAGDDLYSSV